jgi:putative phage-type endonuclease
MTKQIHIEEHTPEWHEWRATVCSASSAAAVMGKGHFFPKTPFQLYQQETGQKEVFFNNSMRKGHEFEPIALELARNTFGGKWGKALFERELLGVKLGASLDGYDTDHEYPVLEIKCVSKTSPTWLNGIGHYIYQVQQQLAVTDSEKALFFVFCIDTKEYKYEIIERRNSMWSEILDAWIDYKKAVDNFEAPKLGKSDYVENNDEQLLALADRLKQLKADKKVLETEIKVINSALIEAANGSPTRFNKVAVFPVHRGGKVDYSKIPLPNDIDLEQYKTEIKTTWSVK